MRNILVFFSTTALIIMMTSIKATGNLPSSDRVNELIADWERAKAFTKEYLEAMSDEGLSYRPTPEARSFAEQMLHLAMGNQGIVSTSLQKERLFTENIEKSDQYKTREALTKAVMESYDFVIASIKELNDDQLKEKVKFFNGQEYTRETGLAKAFEHQTHHRGQTTIYLRMKGVTPPAEKLF